MYRIKNIWGAYLNWSHPKKSAFIHKNIYHYYIHTKGEKNTLFLFKTLKIVIKKICVIILVIPL